MRRRPLEKVAHMSMPETAIYENNRLVPRENKIRSPWKRGNMELVSVSSGVQTFSDQQFRLRVFVSDASHHPASFFGGNDINQVQKSFRVILYSISREHLHSRFLRRSTEAYIAQPLQLPGPQRHSRIAGTLGYPIPE